MHLTLTEQSILVLFCLFYIYVPSCICCIIFLRVMNTILYVFLTMITVYFRVGPIFLHSLVRNKIAWYFWDNFDYVWASKIFHAMNSVNIDDLKNMGLIFLTYLAVLAMHWLSQSHGCQTCVNLSALRFSSTIQKRRGKLRQENKASLCQVLF